MSPDPDDPHAVIAGATGPFDLHRARTWQGGALVACLAVLAGMGLRLALEPFAKFYYLPMVSAVMVTALMAPRSSVILSIVLSVAGIEWTVRRGGMADTLANASLFTLVALAVAEACNRLRAARDAARTLARNLEQRKTLLTTILSSMPVVTLDEQGRMQRITRSAAALFDLQASEAVGRRFDALVPGFETTATDGSVRGEEPPKLWSVQRQDADPVLLTIEAHRLADDAAPERFVLTLTDQSQAEAARRQERELNDRLSSVWRLNSMGEMAATLAHEMNQPLSAAAVYLHAGQADLARLGPTAEPAVQTLDLAKAQLLRAGDIIRRMREMIANGSRAFAEERISRMVRDLEPVIALIGQNAGVVVRIEIDDADDRVLADRIQFQQALTNLIRNAVDAVAGRDDGRVVVTGRSLGTEGYEISVQDNGPGIPDGRIERIFDPMTSTKSGGMGLGLSVTRSIVESHGSALVVGRPPDGGACFTFRLSRSMEAEAA
ncbi:Sensor protein FixL [Brevundimonas sp. SH203]|uniref:sensor histidine kinase n=1 Tax=Brevundimonas sp. SH203 TaxID=345167 RepID=UPI0009C9EE03|nr:ATP-binding protein [Brevundimonas sp. SH203]GAW41481.1 Sensor protein FixL [Brevundimonas sp. SH203]